MKFNDLKTTKLGYLGEKHIPEFCSAKGVKCYQPTTEGSHPVDSMGMTKNNKVFGVEVKTKPRLTFYNKTGFDLADYKTYINLDFPVYVLFVDHLTESIYGQWLSKLSHFKEIQGTFVYFPLDCMELYRELTREEINELKLHSSSNYF